MNNKYFKIMRFINHKTDDWIKNNIKDNYVKSVLYDLLADDSYLVCNNNTEGENQIIYFKDRFSDNFVYLFVPKNILYEDKRFNYDSNTNQPNQLYFNGENLYITQLYTKDNILDICEYCDLCNTETRSLIYSKNFQFDKDEALGRGKANGLRRKYICLKDNIIYKHIANCSINYYIDLNK